jgi:NAD(P)-dependent dehydrogenase (short-subunit alcohol dehydrogenase family)
MTDPLMTSLVAGYSALVIGASGGIGSAVARQLEMDTNCRKVVRLSRREDGLDLTDEDSMLRAAEALKTEEFDLIFCATGALTIDGVGPEKSIRQISQASMMAQFAVNAVGPALVLKHFAPLLAKKRRVIFALLSARVGSIGDNALGGWISYRSSKAALNQIVHTAAIEIFRMNPSSLIVAVHPGTVSTPLSDAFGSGHQRSEPDDAASRILRVLDRFSPSYSGGFLAYDGSTVPW